MAAIPPNNNLEGLIGSLKQGIYGAYNKGVKYGRYLEQQERKHGHWKVEYPGRGVWEACKCSECDSYISPAQYYNYCPFCGARMDKEVVAEVGG